MTGLTPEKRPTGVGGVNVTSSPSLEEGEQTKTPFGGCLPHKTKETRPNAL